MATRLFVADDKFPDVITELQARGWTRFPHDAFPHFALRWTNYAKIAWPRVRAHQIVNHFHGAVVLSRKNELATRLYASSNRTTRTSVDAFYPRTLDLAKSGDPQKLAAWFLYARAVGVVKAVLEQPSHRCGHDEIHAATAYLEMVVRLDGFFACWWTSEMDVTTLQLESARWAPLRRKATMTTTAINSSPMTINRDDLETLLRQLRELDVQFDSIAAGHGDVWICKPSNLSQGRGIHLLTDLDALLRLAPHDAKEASKTSREQDHAESNTTSTRAVPSPSWVVQKYIERPLLLQNDATHKFDVRQWVLITSLDPLTVYWYKDCYLRFCSHKFTLANDTLGDNFTHLSNYSIQKDVVHDAEYQNVDSMWLSSRFQAMLRCVRCSTII